MALAVSAIAALWALFDATGVRPEWVLPVLWIESNFDPTLPNREGAPYYGIGQTSGAWLQAHGIAPADFLTWSAADQIRAAVQPYFAAVVARYGPIRSGVRAYQANFLPATLPTARALSAIVTVRGEAAYNANRSLDFLRDGAITLSDLAAVVSFAAHRPEVQGAIVAAYAQRPDERPTPPVLGAEYTDPRAWLLAPVAIGAYAAGR